MNLSEKFIETIFIGLLIIGLLFSLLIQSAFIHYIVIFLFGVIVISFNAVIKKRVGLAYVIVIVGFVLGFLIGTMKASRFFIFILFIIGLIFGYWLKKKLNKYL
jgi:hypothetical protein